MAVLTRACAVLLLSVLSASAQAVPDAEYQLKAVFLFNFAQFVQWPPAVFGGAGSPVVIGVLGDDPFGAYLDEVVRDEKVENRPLVVQRYRKVEDIKTCHVLFISRSETSRLEPILAALKAQPILSVSDAEGFIQRGGMVRLGTVQNKIRLTIHVEATKAANLTISSKLLRSATVVTPLR